MTAPRHSCRSLMTDSRRRGITFSNQDAAPLQAGAVVKALFHEDRPGGFRLVHASFGPGYRLPRHTHSADCLYYVVSGEAIMRNRTDRVERVLLPRCPRRLRSPGLRPGSERSRMPDHRRAVRLLLQPGASSPPDCARSAPHRTLWGPSGVPSTRSASIEATRTSRPGSRLVSIRWRSGC
jgi:hypothetical protein